MAKIIRRIWTSAGPTGKRVKHVAYGFTLMVNGKRERKVSSEWLMEQDALAALAQRQKEVTAGVVGRPADRTLGELAEEYLRSLLSIYENGPCVKTIPRVVPPPAQAGIGNPGRVVRSARA